MSTCVDFEVLFDEIPALTPREEAMRRDLLRSWHGHEDRYFGSAAVLEAKYPMYYRRLDFSVAQCRGVCLELGCGLGNMTRFIAESDAVTRVVAVDRESYPVVFLQRRGYPKIRALALPHAGVPVAGLEPGLSFDTFLSCELIEHITTDDEHRLLRSFASHLRQDTRFIISTPIGFMEDPTHIRGFSKTEFIDHVEEHYGEIDKIDYGSGYSQVAVGRLTRHG